MLSGCCVRAATNIRNCNLYVIESVRSAYILRDLQKNDVLGKEFKLCSSYVPRKNLKIRVYFLDTQSK